MNKVISFFKGILGLFLFYFIQIGWQLLFLKVIEKNNLVTNNIILIIMEVILVVVFTLMNFKRLKQDYKDFNKNFKEYLKLGLKYWALGFIIMGVSNTIISNFITNNIAANEETNRLLLLNYPVYSVLAMTVMGPYIEELVFRANFRDAFNKTSFIIFTTLLFAGVHVFNGFSGLIDLVYFIPYGSLAFFFALTYVKTNNIFTTIIIHTMHNTLAVILLIYAYTMGV